jgi:hypothetical protein
MIRTGVMAVLLAGAAANLVSCASTPQNTYTIKKLAPAKLYVRRPPSVPAHPKATPGGYDYVSHPLPGGQMDCQETRSLAQGFDLKAFRACIAEVNQNPEKPKFRFRLQRIHQPVLELQDPEDAPECVRNLLGKIPVPREIFFQSLPTKLPKPQSSTVGTDRPTQDVGPYYDCYASSIDLEADELMGVKMSKAKWELLVEFPLKKIALRTDEEALRVYLGWAIMPFFDKEKDEWNIPAKYVPFHICRMCLGEQQMLKTGDPLPLLWP